MIRRDPTAAASRRQRAELELCWRVVRFVTKHEIAVVALLSPLLLFPNKLTGTAALVLILLWPARWATRGAPSARTILDVPISVISLMTIVGMFVSINLAASWPKFWGVLLGVAVYYALVNSLTTRHAIVRAVWMILLAGVASAVVALLVVDWGDQQYYNLTVVTNHIPRLSRLVALLPTGGVRPLTAGGSSLGRTAVLGLQPREAGGMMALLCPLPVAILLSRTERAIRLAAAFCVLVFAAIVILAQALTAVTGLIAALLLLAARRQRRLVWLYASCLLLVAGVIILHPALVLHFSDPSGKIPAGVLERFRIWAWSLEAIRNEPMTGVGLNSLDYTLNGLYPTALIPDEYNALNLFIQMAADIGLPGLFAFVYLLVAVWRVAGRAARGDGDSPEAAVVVGVAAGMVAYVIYGTMDTFTLGAKPGVMFWALLGLAVAAARLLPKPRVTVGNVHRPVRVVLAGLLFLGALAVERRSIASVVELNGGTLLAHKALAAALANRNASGWEVAAGHSMLTAAEAKGAAPIHSDELLMALDGIRADCPGMIRFARRTVERGGDQPFGAAQFSRIAPSVPSTLPSAPGSETWNLWLSRWDDAINAKLFLPRTPETLLQIYGYEERGWLTHWGPESRYWGIYVEEAVVNTDLLGNRDAVTVVIERGMTHAANVGPISCAATELENQPR